MFKDKNFGLPQSLIDDVSKILEETRTNSMKTPSAIGDRVAADMQAKEKQGEEEMGEKVKRFAQPKLPYKLQDRLSKEKNPLVIPSVTESVKFAKFTKYLNENYHVEQLTEEEIQWVFENEFVHLKEASTEELARREAGRQKALERMRQKGGDTSFIDNLKQGRAAIQRALPGAPKPTNPAAPPRTSTYNIDPIPQRKSFEIDPIPQRKSFEIDPIPQRKSFEIDPIPTQTSPVSTKTTPETETQTKTTGSDYTPPSSASRRPSSPSRPSRTSGGNGGDWRQSIFEPESSVS